MALLEFSIIPLGQGESVGEYVARCVAIVRQSGLQYELHAMGTVVEGDVTELLQLLQKCLDATTADCDRVTCSAKFDIRRNHQDQLRGKVASVDRRLGNNLLDKVVEKQVVGGQAERSGEAAS
jgi:uncharacterized protein (TIGR00106 family)